MEVKNVKRIVSISANSLTSLSLDASASAPYRGPNCEQNTGGQLIKPVSNTNNLGSSPDYWQNTFVQMPRELESYLYFSENTLRDYVKGELRYIKEIGSNAWRREYENALNFGLFEKRFH
jgi:hypothetical protein